MLLLNKEGRQLESCCVYMTLLMLGRMRRARIESGVCYGETLWGNVMGNFNGGMLWGNVMGKCEELLWGNFMGKCYGECYGEI